MRFVFVGPDIASRSDATTRRMFTLHVYETEISGTGSPHIGHRPVSG